jgi:hypothetical protein
MIVLITLHWGRDLAGDRGKESEMLSLEPEFVALVTEYSTLLGSESAPVGGKHRGVLLPVCVLETGACDR